MPPSSANSPVVKIPFCFISYARGSGASFAERFAQDLGQELSDLRKFQAEEDPIFLDQHEILPGSKWPERLETGLKKSKVMVSLLSEHYLLSEYCGKEFQVFRKRRDDLRSSKNLTETPPLIIPILWVPEGFLGSQIPNTVKEIQYATQSWGKEYWEVGLLQFLKNLGKYTVQYKDFLRKLAAQILTVSKVYPLEDLGSLEELANVPSAFVDGMANTAAAPADGGWIQFVYVAATQAEAAAFASSVGGYDPNGGPFWRPYLPLVKETIGAITQNVASTEGFVSGILRTDTPLLQHIREAREQNNLLIILLDGWSLSLNTYRNWIRSYDDVFSANCEILIPLNAADPQFPTRKNQIEPLLRQTFPQRVITQGLDTFAVRATSDQELRKKLAEKIQEVRARITNLKAQLVTNPAVPGNLPSISGPGAPTR